MNSMVEFVARLLEPNDREVVLGDLAESDANAWACFNSVLGFIAQQQFEPWRSWRPWLAGSVALPGGLLLLGVSFGLSVDSLSLHHAGTMQRTIILEALLMIAWAWTSGFMVGSLSRRTRWMSAALCTIPCLSCVLRFQEASMSRFCVLLFLAPALIGAAQGVRRARLHFLTAIALAASITGLMFIWRDMSAWNWSLALPAWWLVFTAQGFETSKQELAA
jgi:hypothetical protein